MNFDEWRKQYYQNLKDPAILHPMSHAWASGHVAAACRLMKIAEIIETVDRRAQFGAVVTPTLEEMTQDEMSEIYKLAKGTGECDLCKKDGVLFSSIYGNLCQKCNEEAEHDHHEDSNPRLDGESA